MQIYAVFLPSGLAPPRAAEKVELVRQGFSWSAFLLPPVWALRHGLWLALALWLGWVVLSAAMASLGHLGAAGSLAVYALGALAFGLESDRFRQARLSRSGFLLHGLALGESMKEAESLYFKRRSDLNRTPASVAAARPGGDAGEDVRSRATNNGADLLGLFPSRETRN